MTATFISAGAIPSMSITPDILRLIIVLAFVYGAILDYRTRRVYNEFWIPLIGLCFIVLAWDTALLVVPNTIGTTGYLFSMGVSLLVVPSIAFTLWQADILGGADLKALAFLAVFFPEVPRDHRKWRYIPGHAWHHIDVRNHHSRECYHPCFRVQSVSDSEKPRQCGRLPNNDSGNEV
jgi:Type IV leader peptidase family.